jgi:protein-tyrosine phosphatase
MIYPWPDLGVPREPPRFRRAMHWLLRQAADGKRVEIGCAGGHGRTGTTLAALLVLQGMPAAIRSRYCAEAIETKGQSQMLQVLRR